MSTCNVHGKGLARPHKAEAPKPGIGSNLANAKTINTEQSGHGMRSSGGVAHSYFQNSRAAVHPNLDKHPHD